MSWKFEVDLDQEFLLGILGHCSHFMIPEVLPSVQGSFGSAGGCYSLQKQIKYMDTQGLW